MRKKGTNFFEEHVEKIVLAGVVLVCIWFLITHVLIGPNYIKYDNKKFGPGEIDSYISKQAEVLEEKLNRKPEPKQPYKPRFDDFTALLDSTIRDIDTDLIIPQPIITKDVNDNRAYRLPLLGEANDISVEHIRAVAYVPTEVVNEENTYSQEGSEPNDIDFVTVEAKFDVVGLYDKFYESFTGENVREEWRDPCLAKPIFAAIQLQRQELLPTGSWSDWQVVPRANIDHRKKTFEVIEDLEDLPAGGIKVRLLQFDNPVVRMDLLQPEAYRIASAKEEWFPPSLRKEYLEYQREIDVQEKRDARAAEKKEREQGRERSRTTTRRPGGGGPPGYGGGGGPFGGGGGGPPIGGGGLGARSSSRSRRRARKPERERPEKTEEISKKTTTDVYEKFNDILLTEQKDIAEMDEPLLFWAHDDTVELEKSYRYRIRLGVFNPVAGTNQFSKQDKSLRNKVILWGNFSGASEAVHIPGKLYFFPTNIQEATETVTVQVARYVLGYWYSKDFTVKQGEVIGKVSEYKITKEEQEKNVTVPKTVDYTTGAVLVDVMPVNDWSGGKNLRPRHYFDVLYSFDGTDIDHIPVKSRNWDEQLQVKYGEIKKSEKEPKEPLQDWGTKRTLRRRAPRPGEGMPPGYGPPGYGAPPGYGPPGY